MHRLHAVLEDGGGGRVEVDAAGEDPVVVVLSVVGVLLLRHRQAGQDAP